MARAPSTFLNMLAALFLSALISSVALGGVYVVTKDAIARSRLQGQLSLLRAVLPSFDNDPYEEQVTVTTDQGAFAVYPARREGHLVGLAVEAFSLKGYAGRVGVMVGFLPDGSIYDSLVSDHKETPGLGSKLDPAQSNFSAQFRGKQPQHFKLMVKKDGGDVDAITAATVSSRAYCDALKAAHAAFKGFSL